ncbi:Lrp/AsnC family transcriptional regulator [Halobacteriaceae archaeon GCM10025711]
MSRDLDDSSEYVLDDIDRGILYELQQDARNTTAQEIADAVDVSPSTVRNRIANLEDNDIIEGYHPKINYERAGFALRVLFVGTAPPKNRDSLAKACLKVAGVVDVREMLTSRRNLYIEAVATSTSDLTAITQELIDLDIEILSSEIISSQYSQPFGELEF